MKYEIWNEINFSAGTNAHTRTYFVEEPVNVFEQDDIEPTDKPEDEFVDGTPDGDDIPAESDDPNANKSVDAEDSEA